MGLLFVDGSFWWHIEGWPWCFLVLKILLGCLCLIYDKLLFLNIVQIWLVTVEVVDFQMRFGSKARFKFIHWAHFKLINRDFVISNRWILQRLLHTFWSRYKYYRLLILKSFFASCISILFLSLRIRLTRSHRRRINIKLLNIPLIQTS